MFVEVGTTFRIGRAADGYAIADTPAQMQQSLYVVRMKVRQHDGVEVAGRKTFMSVGESGIEQDAAVSRFNQG